jgi:hypothetical protein
MTSDAPADHRDGVAARQEGDALVLYGDTGDAWLASETPVDLTEAR